MGLGTVFHEHLSNFSKPAASLKYGKIAEIVDKILNDSNFIQYLS
jgi:hypothetical protein